MRITSILATIIITTTLVLTGCTISIEPTGTVTTTTVTAPKVAAPVVLTAAQRDRVFLSVLDDEGIYFPTSELAIKLGHAIADLGDRGYDMHAAADIAVLQNHKNKIFATDDQCRFFVGAAYTAYRY